MSVVRNGRFEYLPLEEFSTTAAASNPAAGAGGGER
jgi:hypothetical protein